MRYDELIDALAATQDGVASRRQLLDAGVSARAIDDRIAAGRLVRMHAGVYLVRGHSTSWRSALRGAVMALGGEAVASHRAAGFLHGLAGVDACL